MEPILDKGTRGLDNPLQPCTSKDPLPLERADAVASHELTYSRGCKHDVFVNHSGFQKNFAEQLHMDLKREGISSFFDKDSESLPMGEEFPSRIFEAAEKCKVALLVLSHEFIASNWPMQELCAFVKAKNTTNPTLAVLPLFFEISPRALSLKIQDLDPYAYWKDVKISPVAGLVVEDLLNALNKLRSFNGIEYIEREGEVAYRSRIVEHVRDLVPTKLKCDDSDVQGKERLCKEVAMLFQRTPAENGIKVAGLVFHVELQREESIKTLRHALRILTGASEYLVNSVTSIEHISSRRSGWHLLKERMSGNRVFLALDNISDDSIKEAQSYVRAVCCGKESMILLTSRSSAILNRFVPEDNRSLMPLQGLTEEEAIAVLLQLTPVKSSNLTSEEKIVARKCVQKCCFRWDFRNGAAAYHPLVLRTFGEHLYDKFNFCTDLCQWKKIPNFSNGAGGPMQKVFSIFEESFKLLSLDCVKIFMLLCLYLPQMYFHSSKIIAWTGWICDKQIQDIENFIIQLRNKGFIEKGSEIYIHDLLKDFAESKADGTGRWISLKAADEIPRNLQRRQAWSNDRPQLEAMRLQNCKFWSLAMVNNELLCNVSVLHLEDMPNLEKIDLGCMEDLTSISIKKCPMLEEIEGLQRLSRSLRYLRELLPISVWLGG
eukprot:Gb_00842 [translate_table: standard]